MQKPLFESALIATGCLIFLFSLSFDLFYQGSPGIGFRQLIGMTIGLIIILIGLRYLLLPDQTKWDWLLFVIYLSGILFVGLQPIEAFPMHSHLLLALTTFSKRDFALNVAGFVPLGFLVLPLVRHNIGNNKTLRLIAVAAMLGFSASLAIETLQYLWLPGRFSSAYDLTANTAGAVIGAACYVILRTIRLIS